MSWRDRIAKVLTGYHGSPKTDLTYIAPSQRGPLGPGGYFSPWENVAQRYAGEGGRLYQAEVPDTFHGLGSRFLPSDVNPYEVWRGQGAQLTRAAPDKASEIEGLLRKMDPMDGYPFFGRLSHIMGSQEAAQKVMQGAGFKGASGWVDGPEIVSFNPFALDIRPAQGAAR